MRTLYPACPLDDEGRAVTLSVISLSIPYLYQATCKAVGGGQRVCTCPPHFGGDGFSCYGDIIQVRCSLPYGELSSRGPVGKGLAFVLRSINFRFFFCLPPPPGTGGKCPLLCLLPVV